MTCAIEHHLKPSGGNDRKSYFLTLSWGCGLTATTSCTQISTDVHVMKIPFYK